MATVKCRQGDLALGSSGFPKVPTTNTLAIHLPVSGLLGWGTPNCPWELQGRRTSLGNPGLLVWVGSGCRKIPPGQLCDVWLWHIPLAPFLVPVTPQSVCTHASAHTTWTKAQMKTHVGGHIHVEVYPHTYRGTCVCVHAQRHTHTGDPSHPVPGFLPGGTSFPSQLQQQGSQCSPHHPLWPGPRPSPCTSSATPVSLALMHSLQSGPLCGFPWPSPHLLSSCEDCHDLWPPAPHFLHTLLEAAQWPHWPLYGCLRTCVWNPVTSSLVMPMLPSGVRLGLLLHPDSCPVSSSCGHLPSFTWVTI